MKTRPRRDINCSEVHLGDVLHALEADAHQHRLHFVRALRRRGDVRQHGHNFPPAHGEVVAHALEGVAQQSEGAHAHVLMDRAARTKAKEEGPKAMDRGGKQHENSTWYISEKTKTELILNQQSQFSQSSRMIPHFSVERSICSIPGFNNSAHNPSSLSICPELLAVATGVFN